jgi:hypothetical protein
VETARAVFDGPSYIAASERWARLRRERGRVARLLMEAARHEDADAFRSDAQAVLRRVFDEDFELTQARRDDRFAELVRGLWLSYDVNVVLPAERPADREPLLDWLRFLALIGPALEDEPAFHEAVAELSSARPIVPFGLLGPGRIPPRPRTERRRRLRRPRRSATCGGRCAGAAGALRRAPRVTVWILGQGARSACATRAGRAT